MNSIKNDRYFIEKAIENISIIKEYSNGLSYEDFLNDKKVMDAIMFRLVQLIENIKSISPEYKEQRPYVPWGDIMGFRNGIVHEYGKTDYIEVYQIISRDLDDLIDIFKESLN